MKNRIQRITAILKRSGLIINKKKVQRLVQKLKLQVKSYSRKSRKYSSYKGQVGKISDNKIKRNIYYRKKEEIESSTNRLIYSKRYLLDGKTPRISATNIDNGILGYYEDIDDKNYRVFENFISVSFLGAVFYHKYKASLDMKIHCLKLKNKELNKEVAFYLTSIIRQALKNTEYKDQISSTVLPDIKIKLPIDSRGTPDWNYMERYIEDLKLKCNIANYNI